MGCGGLWLWKYLSKFQKIITNVDHFGYKFRVVKGADICHKNSLEMSKTLARFRDPIWCSHTQQIGRAWLFVQYWSRGYPIIILGVLFAIVIFMWWFENMIVFTLLVLHDMIELTLILLACWCVWYEGHSNGRTWRLYQFFLYNGDIFLKGYPYPSSKKPYFEENPY